MRTEKKPSLASLMGKVFEIEAELINASPEEMQELFGDIRDKVDNIHEYLKRLDEYDVRLSDKIKTLQDQKKTIVNKSKKLKEYVAWVMKSQDTPELFGNEYAIKLQSRESIKAKSIEITSDHYLDLNEAAKAQVVKRSYSWDAMALKAAYKKDPEKFKNYVEIDTTIFPRFSIRKDS